MKIFVVAALLIGLSACNRTPGVQLVDGEPNQGLSSPFGKMVNLPKSHFKVAVTTTPVDAVDNFHVDAFLQPTQGGMATGTFTCREYDTSGVMVEENEERWVDRVQESKSPMTESSDKTPTATFDQKHPYAFEVYLSMTYTGRVNSMKCWVSPDQSLAKEVN